jgi:DNA-binding GntR family transcriptional regulator
MPLTPLPRASLAREAYGALLEAIVSGRLAPGQRVRDKELAEQFGVSRVPVREALKRLEEEGLVETVPNLLTRVAPVRAEQAAQAFPVVAALHALGARLGVPALSRADDEEMRRLDERRTTALARRDIVAAIDADDALHDVLLRASKNLELQRALARLMPQVRRLDVLHFARLADGGVAGDHAAMLAACRRRDAAEAAALVEESFLALGRQMTALLEAAGDDAG